MRSFGEAFTRLRELEDALSQAQNLGGCQASECGAAKRFWLFLRPPKPRCPPFGPQDRKEIDIVMMATWALTGTSNVVQSSGRYREELRLNQATSKVRVYPSGTPALRRPSMNRSRPETSGLALSALARNRAMVKAGLIASPA